MKLAKVMESGVSGAAGLALIQEAMHLLDNRMPRASLLHKTGVFNNLQNENGTKKTKNTLAELGGEILTNAAFFGLVGLGSKKNALKRGALIGAAAGLGATFIKGADENGVRKTLPEHAATLALYTAGGVLAGLAMQELPGLTKKLKGKGRKNKKNRK
ncbi:MAG TPA: hypothetical protein VHK69_14220 [Chitinophagaceae bacterium]|jgi:hypothetical protein|nr:hypothetical protein [Chitinophagaceae bacterium]